jgi:hypothetical protein
VTPSDVLGNVPSLFGQSSCSNGPILKLDRCFGNILIPMAMAIQELDQTPGFFFPISRMWLYRYFTARAQINILTLLSDCSMLARKSMVSSQKAYICETGSS